MGSGAGHHPPQTKEHRIEEQQRVVDRAQGRDHGQKSSNSSPGRDSKPGALRTQSFQLNYTKAAGSRRSDRQRRGARLQESSGGSGRAS